MKRPTEPAPVNPAPPPERGTTDEPDAPRAPRPPRTAQEDDATHESARDTAATPSAMLTRLAREAATGVLIRDHGVLYLHDGQVVHAESPAAPGLDVLLTASGALAPERWQEAVDRAGALGRVARYLVDSGGLTEGALQLCHLGALFDAAYFALGPTTGPTRFRPGAGHWLGHVQRVPVQAVARESRRRRALLACAGVWPGADTAPTVRRRPPADQRVPSRLRAVLLLADGVRTPSAIAWTLGRPAFHTLIEIHRLAAAGLVEPAPSPYDGPTGPDTATAIPPHRGRPAAHPLPAVRPLSPVRPRDGRSSRPADDDPDIVFLRRLRDALEAQL